MHYQLLNFILLWEWTWCHCVFYIRQDKRLRCCQSAETYSSDYKKTQLKCQRTQRDMLWHHVHSQSGMKFTVKLNSYSNASIFFFYCFVACAFPFFEVKSVLPIDWYQNATSKAISLHKLKKVQLQERYTLVTQDSIGHLKMLCMSVLSLVVAFESEWKRYSSSQSDGKTLAFEYEFSFSV